MNGKGSGRRPAAVPDAQVQTEWDRIFGQIEPGTRVDVYTQGPDRLRLLRPAGPIAIPPERQ